MLTSSENGTTARAGRREWLGLVVLVLPALLLSVDLTVLFLALPHLAQDLQPSSTQQLWAMDIYGFMLAGFLVTMGTVGDRIGRRKLLLIGGAFFGIASVIAAYSTSPEMLIAARALLGIAGATLAPSTLSLITNMFHDTKQRSTAVAVWTGCFVGGGIIGPILGGFMLSSFWWGSVLLLAVPVMVLLLIAGPLLLPEYRKPEAGKIDVPSVALSLLTILPVIYGIKELAREGVQMLDVAALALGILFGVLFVRRQHTLADPLLDLKLFRIPLLRNELILGLLVGSVTGGTLLLVNLQLQLVEGLSPLRTGLWLVPGALSTLVAIGVSTGLAAKIRPARLMAGGLLVAMIGCGVLATIDPDGGVLPIVIAAVLINAGLGPVLALGYNILISAAPADRTGSASALTETSGEFGVAAGIAVLGSIGAAVYHGGITIPQGVPAGIADSARESLASAVAVAGELPGPTADALLASARDAFTSGVNLVGTLSGVLFAVLAVFTWRWFRQVPTTTSDAATTATDDGSTPGTGGTPPETVAAARS